MLGKIISCLLIATILFPRGVFAARTVGGVEQAARVKYRPFDYIEIETDAFGGRKVRHRLDLAGLPVAEVELSAKNPAETDYLNYDHLGSCVLVTDQKGEVKQKPAYAPYGTPLNGDGQVVWKNWEHEEEGYAQTGLQPESELLMTWRRPYDPVIGKFLQSDPVLSENAFGYAANNPIHFVDPSGFEATRINIGSSYTPSSGGGLNFNWGPMTFFGGMPSLSFGGMGMMQNLMRPGLGVVMAVAGNSYISPAGIRMNFFSNRLMTFLNPPQPYHSARYYSGVYGKYNVKVDYWQTAKEYCAVDMRASGTVKCQDGRVAVHLCSGRKGNIPEGAAFHEGVHVGQVNKWMPGACKDVPDGVVLSYEADEGFINESEYEAYTKEIEYIKDLEKTKPDIKRRPNYEDNVNWIHYMMETFQIKLRKR